MYMKRITYMGRTQSISKWAAELGFVATTLYARMARGKTFEEAISEPARPFKYRREDLKKGGLARRREIDQAEQARREAEREAAREKDALYYFLLDREGYQLILRYPAWDDAQKARWTFIHDEFEACPLEILERLCALPVKSKGGITLSPVTLSRRSPSGSPPTTPTT